MEWISVEKSKPDYLTREVICAVDLGRGLFSIPLTWRREGFYFFDGDYKEFTNVLYWMPLPSPPK